MIRPLAAALTAAALLAGCGGEDSGRFDAAVQEVRDAVEAGDRAGAHEALDEIAALGLAAGAEGELADAEVQELARLLEQGRALVDEDLPPATTTTAPPRSAAADGEVDEVEAVPSEGPGAAEDDDGWSDGDDDDGGDDEDEDRGPGRGKGHKGKGD